MVFFSKTLAERTPPGTRQSVKEQGEIQKETTIAPSSAANP